MTEQNNKMATVKDGLVKALGILPQNLISLAMGSLVRAPLPTAISKPMKRAFVSTFGINMAEAERPLHEYRTVEDIFTRRLQPGSRKVADGLVSPADGMLERSEPANQGKAIQAKGISYSLAELVFGPAGKSSKTDFEPTWFTTIYLAPHNYHRVHTPCPGTAIMLRYIPGRLWPVNRPAVRSIPGLFCRNERLVFDLELSGGGRVWVVMVGALNVGRIVTPLRSEFVSNAASRQLGSSEVVEMPVRQSLASGDEIGTFMLGSTVVVVYDKLAMETLKPQRVDAPIAVRMGQSLSG